MSIKVITPGMLSTIQDGGRKGFAAMGFNASGVMDVRSYHIANALVGNFTDEAVIEMTYLGGSFKFLESNYIAITGADMSPKLDGVPVEMYTTVFVKQDETLTFSAAESGMRAYIAVRGGIDVPVIMGSRSTNLKCKLGGLDGRPLKAGDIVPCRDVYDEFHKHLIHSAPKEDFGSDEITVRVLLGPQDDYFTDHGIKTFLNSTYTVTNESDRMGCKLSGEKIEYKNTVDIISDGIVFGSIQIPRTGNPIIMLADRQTTGGYAKIATVISVDLPLLAQARPGTKVHFELIDRQKTERLLKQEQKEFHSYLLHY